jgi:transcriptional regulator with XRE-family HTH domain
MTETTPKKPKKPKFKYTRELVRIAIADGMTQEEIGNLCRVSQSIVSGWQRGESLAFEHQVAELKKRYGNRLNRTTSRVYLVAAPATNSRWEDSERGKRLLALSERLRVRREEEQAAAKERAKERAHRDEVVVLEVGTVTKREPTAEQVELAALTQELLPDAEWAPLELLIQADQEQFDEAERPKHLTQVEGPIVLRYTFVRPHLVQRGNTSELARVPVGRWLVHRHPEGRFVLVRQAPRVLAGTARWRWWVAQHDARNPSRRRSHRDLKVEDFMQEGNEASVESTDDAARWLSEVHGPMDADALLSECDRYIRDPKTLHGPHDELTLPFLVRKMLVEHGQDVPGVVRVLASE